MSVRERIPREKNDFGGPMKKPGLKESLNDVMQGLGEVNSEAELGMVIDRIKEILGYDYLVDGTTHSHLLWCLKGRLEESRDLLGQVNTPEYIAELISRLCIKTKNDYVIDPCFGEGVFLISSIRRLREHQKDLVAAEYYPLDQVFGIELDPGLFLSGLVHLHTSSGQRNIPPNFFNGDFFDYKRQKGRFDVALMNPPYVRHEELTRDLPFLNKKTIREKVLEDKQNKIFNKSNLYVYFLVYLTEFLREGGRLGVITSNTWLDTSFGRGFQQFLLDNFHIEYIIDFDRDTFSDVAVESCILVLRRECDQDSEDDKTNFVLIKERLPVEDLFRSITTKGAGVSVREKDQADLREDPRWGKYLYGPEIYFEISDNPLLVPLHRLANVRRGVTTNCNKFFIPKEETIKRFGIEPEHLRHIICSPKDIDFFDTKRPPRLSKILLIETGRNELLESSHKCVLNYLDEWEKRLFETRKPSSLKTAFTKDRGKWFTLKAPKTAPLIFSYIIRNDKAFILNSERYLVRDNFYNISPHSAENTMVLFGVLNSTITRLLLEFAGRKHGRGLLKVQVYELLGLPVTDINRMSPIEREEITNMAFELAGIKIDDKENRDRIIHRIDEIILGFLKTERELREIIEAEHDLVSARRLRKQVISAKG